MSLTRSPDQRPGMRFDLHPGLCAGQRRPKRRPKRRPECRPECPAAGRNACTASAPAGLDRPQRLASITIRKGRFCATGSLHIELPL